MSCCNHATMLHWLTSGWDNLRFGLLKELPLNSHLEGVTAEQQKNPDLWMIKAGFVGSKEAAAEALKQAKWVACMPLQEDCGKQTRMDDWHKVVRAEGADSPKEAQTEGAQPEGAAAPESSFKVWIAINSSQTMSPSTQQQGG
jgi:hypothetical protein